MILDRFNADSMPAPAVPLSHGVLAGGWLYTAGMVARAPDGSIIVDNAQSATQQCLENMEAVLATRGADRNAVVRITVYLDQIADYGAMNLAFDDFFAGVVPARTTIQAGALGLG